MRSAQITFCLLAAVFTAAAYRQGTATQQASPGEKAAMDSMSSMHMDAHMGKHMLMTSTRPSAPGDADRAAAIVATLRDVLPQFRDYHAAVADGFTPFAVTLHELETQDPPSSGPGEGIIHFTKASWALEAQGRFDDAHPTSLLYRRMGKGDLKLVGAMYTAPWRTSDDQLNSRVPLSVARWHEHVNLCVPPRAQWATADWKLFGGEGSIADEAACRAAGATFYPRRLASFC